MKLLRNAWCDLMHGGGSVIRDELGRINWQCKKCGRWANPVPHGDERRMLDDVGNLEWRTSPFYPKDVPRGMDDPDYARIFTQARVIAWQHGFALLAHGSYSRDLDLLMVPWEDRAHRGIVPAVIKRIAQVTGTSIKGEPSDKPHGRKAYTLHLPDMVRWIDLSVIPCLNEKP